MNKLTFLLFSMCILFLYQCTTGEVEDNTLEEDVKKEKVSPEKKEDIVKSAVLKDSTSMSIFDALYGNFNAKAQHSIVEKHRIPENEMEERMGDMIGEGVNLIAKMEYKTELEDGRVIFIVSIAPEEDYECRICAPLLVGGVLKYKKNNWYMGAVEYFDMAGTYGMAPSFKIQRISAYDFAIVEELGDLHMGELWSGEHLYSINAGFKSVFNVTTFSNNSGACDVDGNDDSLPTCYENQTEITYVPTKEGYYEIQTHQTGTEWDYENEKLVELDVKETYTYQGNTYAIKK